MCNDFVNWEKPPFAILSAERAELSAADNAKRSDALRDAFKRGPHDYAVTTGCYAGVTEASALVLLYDGLAGQAWQDVLSYAALNDQESVLYVDAERSAYLFTLADSRLTHLGEWRETTKANAEAMSAYTRGPDGRYWYVEA